MLRKTDICRVLLIAGFFTVCLFTSHASGLRQNIAPLIHNLTLYVDKQGNLTAEQAARLCESEFSAVQSRFTPGFIDGAVWVSFNLEAGGNWPVIISFGPELFDRADAYLYDSDAGWKIADSTGRQVNNQERALVTWRSAVKLDARVPTVPVLIRIRNNDSTHITLQAFRLNDFLDQTVRFSIFHAVILGIIFVIMLYLLLSFIWFRERLFLLLGLTAGAFLCYQLVVKGFAHTYFWNDRHDSLFFSRMSYILCCAGFTLTLVTFIKYLDLIRNPKLYRAAILFLFAAGGILILIFGFKQTIQTEYLVSLWLLIGISIFLCVPITYLLTTKKIQTSSLLIAWLPMLVYAGFRQTYHILRINLKLPLVEALLTNDYYFSYDFCFLFHVIVYTLVITTRLREQKKRENEHKIRDYFFATTAHELIAPVTLIKHAVEELEKSGIAQEGAENFRETIRGNCRRILKVITLFNSLDEQGKQINAEPQKGAFIEPLAILQNIIPNFEFYAKAHGNTIHCTSNIKNNLEVFIDALFLEVVFINLLDNACKYSFENTAITIQLDYDPALMELKYTVHNFGIPISGEEKKRFFDYCYRSETAKQHSPRGNGFGLHMVNRIAQIYEGSVSVHDGYGCISEGNTFTVKMRLKSNKPQNLGDSSKKRIPVYTNEQIRTDENDVAAAENSDAKPPLILIVEDDLPLLQSMEALFSSACQVITAVNGQEAFEKIRQHMPLMVLCDIVLPIMNGMEVYEKCRENEELRTIPFLFISALQQEKIAQQSLEGALDYIQKPFDFAVLQTKVTSLLAYGMNIRQQYANRVSRLISEAALLPAGTLPHADRTSDAKRFARYADCNLTKREREVCELLYAGKSYKYIAENLKTSVNTIATHCKNIYRKLNTQTKADLIHILSE